MPGLFAKAAAKKADTAPAKTKKETVWIVPKDSPEAESVHELVRLTRESKALEAQMGQHKKALKDFGTEHFLRDYALLGVAPETPMTIQTHAGEKVTFVVQDRSAQYNVGEDKQEALAQLLGEDAARDLLFQETSFQFNRDVLAIPGVQEEIEKALERALKKLTDDSAGRPVMTPEQAELLLDVKVKTAFKPGTFDRLALVCGKDVPRMEQFLQIAGSNCTIYTKV